MSGTLLRLVARAGRAVGNAIKRNPGKSVVAGAVGYHILTDDDTDTGGLVGPPSPAMGAISSPGVFKYPLTLGEDPMQPHSVVFYINVREGTRAHNAANNWRANEEKAGRTVSNWASSSALKSADYTSQNRANAENVAQLEGYQETLAPAALGYAGVKFLGGAPAGQLIGAAAGAEFFHGDLPGNSVGLNAQRVRMHNAIELHMSQPPIAQYKADWRNADTGIAGQMLGSIGSAVEQISPGGGGYGEAIKGIFSDAQGPLGAGASRALIGGIAKIPNTLGIGGDAQAAIDVRSGNTLNPYKEQAFTSMGFRQFAFAYKFAPRNKAEYNNVMSIIHLFKYHMHPEVDDTNMTLIYPSEFDIEFRYNGNRNVNLSKISSCALSDVKVTYGNQDSFTTILGESGTPVEINLELAFTELEMLTRSKNGKDGGITDNWRDTR